MARQDHPPAFLFNVDDFVSDNVVEAMTTEQIGAYTLLLCKAWREEPVGTIPDEDTILARWARLTPARWKAIKRPVLKAFKKGDDGRWHQKRMKATFDEWLAGKEKRTRNARAGATARWGGCVEQCDSMFSASSSASSQHSKSGENGCDSHADTHAEKCQSKSNKKSKSKESNYNGQDQTTGPPALLDFDLKIVDEAEWVSTLEDFASEVGDTSEDRRLLAQLAWLVCAGAPILSDVRDAIAAIKSVGSRPASPIGYMAACLKESMGAERLAILLSKAPPRGKCAQILGGL